METNKKYVLITGGSAGIGFELAKLFAKDNFNLILVARDANRLEEAAATLKAINNSDVKTISRDLFEPGAALQLYDEVKALAVDIDILVNDAGQGVYGLFTETDLERELAIIQLNVVSLVVLTKLFVKDMVSKGSGKILNVASIASKSPGPWQAVYHGTKAFVHSFNEAVNFELRETGVTITSLLPGATDTDFFRKADMESAKIVQEGALADASKVALDGYEALMKGDDKVVSGLANKLNVAMGNVTPDALQAKQMNEIQEPANNKKS